jgi:hypothetical protein
MTEEIRGTKAVEDAAIAWVMAIERKAGRDPTDTRYRGAPADISSPPRLIEVKAVGTTSRGYDLWLEVRQVEEARRFYVYVVENIRQGDSAQFTLKVLGRDLLARLLGRAKEQRYFTVPWPVADYDSAPASLEEDPISGPAEETPQSPRPTPRDRPHDSASILWEAAPSVVEFRGDDDGYLAWIPPQGWLGRQRSQQPEAHLPAAAQGVVPHDFGSASRRRLHRARVRQVLRSAEARA